jgi:hypothetical protein
MSSVRSAKRHATLATARWWWIPLLVLSIVGIGTARVAGQTFNSGSDGSDGTFFAVGPPGTVINFDPSQFTGTQVSANIFQFTTITIAAGVTVRLSGNTISGPVYWLAQGNVDISGTIDLNGGNGAGLTQNPFSRVSSVPGAGGYPGGVGGHPGQRPTPGGGPTGGAPGACGGPTDCYAGGGTFPGNSFLIPLIGGAGGGGGDRPDANFGPSGGAGGGALLIASSTQIVVSGSISANGGTTGLWGTGCCDNWPAGGGSGGAIRLISNTISGSGSFSAIGGNTFQGAGGTAGGQGVVRLEAYTVAVTGTVSGTSRQSSPFPLLLPTAGPAWARVVSIGGVAINPNPSTFPDITINTTMPVPVVIQTKNIPTTATVKLTILNQNAVPDTVIQAPPIGNCDQSNLCTTTVDVVFPFGASRGLTRVPWTQ